QCNAVPPQARLTATDNCDPNPTATPTRASAQDPDPTKCGHYNYIITDTWTAKDACGNTSAKSQTITVPDTTAPVLVSCPADASTQSPNATDCAHYTYTITRTFTVKDACNNSPTCSQLITVQDQNNPALVSCPADKTVNCTADTSVTALGNATFTGNCGSPV